VPSHLHGMVDVPVQMLKLKGVALAEDEAHHETTLSVILQVEMRSDQLSIAEDEGHPEITLSIILQVGMRSDQLSIAQ